MGALLAQQLVGVGEHVVDVPPKLSSRVRLMDTGRIDKSDPNDSRSAALVALRNATLNTVSPESEDRVVLRLLADRYHQLTAERTRTVCRLHALLGTKLPGGVMGVAEEKLVMEFLGHDEGPEMDVDAMVAMMTDDVILRVDVPTRKPRVGREAAREELARGAGMSTGQLDGAVLSMVSNDRLVFQERNSVFEMGDKRVTLRLAAVFEVADGKIAAWREYYDTVDLARQLGLDPALLVEESATRTCRSARAAEAGRIGQSIWRAARRPSRPGW